METLDRFFFKPTTPASLYCVRFLVFVVGAIYLRIHSSQHPQTFYDVWNPISFYTLLSEPLSSTTLEVLRDIWLFSSLIAGIGVLFRWTAPLAFVTALIYLGHSYNFNRVYHSTHLYIMTVGILALARAPHPFLFSTKNFTNKFSGEYFWPLRWIQCYVVFAFFVCGLQKLYYGHGLQWIFSENFYLRLLQNPFHPPLNQWILEQPLYVSQVMAFFAIAIEFFAPLALLNRKWAVAFVVAWTAMHALVSATLGTHFQFFSQCFAYAAFLNWDPVVDGWRKKMNYQMQSRTTPTT